MTRILCLANSRKNANRCIAGLTKDGIWIRPVSKLADGSIPLRMRQIGREEPRLLDLLEIPLEASGPDFGHQPENRLVKPGKWMRVGVAEIADVLELCERQRLLLHTNSDRVPEQLIAGLSPEARYSLQLIYVNDARFYETTSFRGTQQIRVQFRYAGSRYDLVVTDPIAEDCTRKDMALSRKCVLTVSMGGPYDGNYFKFVAAVIECP